MKKRFISLLLTVLMVLSLFSGLSVNAYAATTAYGANTIDYTMGQGDYVLRICQKLGLNYYTCKDAIQILNNIYDGQWNRLTVGRVLTLPASDADAVLIANGARQTVVNTGAAATTASVGNVVTGTATTGTLSTANVATFNAAAASADSLAYYLVPYTMSYGETVSGVCNNLGVNFSIFSPFIKQVNNITNWNKVRAGDTLIIPTPVCPSVGTTCYGVMQHVIKSSDTAYGIVNSKGVSYNANEQLLKVLNQTDNLAAIKVGTNFYYPVPLTVSVPGTGNPGSTATTTTTTIVTDGNGTTTTQTTTTAKLYKLTSGMSASDGTMLFYVNNQAVTAAPAGAKVTVLTSTNSGKAVQSLTVKHSDGKADVHLTGDTFIMPSCDARVDASIAYGHDINIIANYSGKATASVKGISVQSAIKGAAVMIKSTDPNYEISSISASYKKLVTASTKTQLTVSSSKAFIMPDADVDVEVVLKPVSTYAFYVNDPANGNFYLEVNGSVVTRAAKGATVTVVAKPDVGYEAKSLVVKNHLNPSDRVNVFSNTFTMPAFDVDVEVTFTGKGNNILIMPSQFANVYAFDHDPIAVATTLDDAVTEADTGDTVYLLAVDEDAIQPLAQKNFNIGYDVVRNSDGLKVSVTKASTDENANLYSFKMPKGGVTVTPTITSKSAHKIYAKFFNNGNPVADYNDMSFSITWNGKTSEFTKTGDEISTLKNIKSQIPAGEYIDLRYDCADGIAFVKYRITDGKAIPTVFEEATNEANLYGYFKMPDANIEIEAYFETGKAALGPAAITGIGSVGYKVLDDYGNWKSANTCEPGDTVMVIVTAGNGYKFDAARYDTRLLISRKDNGAPITPKTISVATLDPNSYAFTFEMPASGADVRAIFDPKPFVITMKCVDEAGNDLTGLGLWQAAIDWVPGIMDNNTNINWFTFKNETKFDVAYGDYVTVAMTEAGWSKYDMVSFRIDDQEYTADVLNYFYNFQMIDDRASNHTITAVMRPKNVAVRNLNAVYDVTKGGVEFMIIDSPSKYSDEFRKNSQGALNYVRKAIAGDKVAIVANSVDSKYTVKASDINIIAWGGDADRIVPTEGWIDAYGNTVAATAPGAIRVFTFTMPNSDVNVTVNYTSKQQGMVISVFDADNNPVNGMVRLFANNFYRDVAANVSFDDVPYRTVVSIVRSELALAEGKVIRDVDISTASGKSINYTDMSNAGEGITFTMPDEPVWVIIRIDDMHYNVPTVVIDTQVVGGSLYFRRSMNEADPVVPLTDFDPGETVYVFDEPAAGYDHLGIGDLKIYVNGMQNAVNIQKVDGRPHVWSFTMREGTIIMQAAFPLEGADEVKLSIVIVPATVDGVDSEVDVTVGGHTYTMKNGADPFNVLEGQSVVINSATDGYAVKSLVSTSGKGVSGNIYVAPDELTGAADILTVTLAAEGYPIQWSTNEGGSLSITDSTGKNIVTAKSGDMITVTAIPTNTNYQVKDDCITLTSLTDGSEVILPLTANTASFPMPAGGVKITASFETATDVEVTFQLATEPADGQATLSMSAGSVTLAAGESRTFKFETGTVITITPAGGYDKAEISSLSTKGISGSKYTVNADNGLNDTVTIKVSSTAKAVTLNVTTDTKYGNISLSHSNSKSVAEPASAFKVGEDLYFFDSPATGYELDTDSLKVTDNATKNVLTIENGGIVKDTTSGCYTILGGIPVDGVTIKASFKAQTVALSFDGNGQVKVSGGGKEYTVTAGTASTVNFSYGDKITLAPVGGFKWNDTGVSGHEVSGTGASNNRTFTVDATGTIALTLAMVQ